MKVKTRISVMFFIVLLVLVLYACNSPSPDPIATSASDTPSSSSSLMITSTPTVRPTKTFRPTSTPKPTENRPQPVDLLNDFFTESSPTFDAALVVTKTPSTLQQCPAGNEDLFFDSEKLYERFETYGDGEYWLNATEKQEYLLDYLNNGGDLQPVLQMCGDTAPYNPGYCGDLTGDGVPELLLKLNPGILQGHFHVFGCMDGEYKQIYEFSDQLNVNFQIINVADMNLDGVPEIVTRMTPDHGFVFWSVYEIMSWNGTTFVSQISQTGFDRLHVNASIDTDYIGTSGFNEGYDSIIDLWQIKDIDNNGTLELIIQGGQISFEYPDFYQPSLPYKLTMMWNGEGFVVSDVKISAPRFRYQAVHNGDSYTLLHKYDLARQSYQAVITNSNLEWWSAEKREYVIFTELPQYNLDATPPPLPLLDENEYPNLAAYARFRLILLDVLEGDLKNADQEFAAMQKAYPVERSGSVYVDFAGAFLAEFQNHADVPLACQAALDYGADHSAELLRYFSQEQGFASRLVYELTDLCPFE